MMAGDGNGGDGGGDDDEDENPLADFPGPPDALNSLELWVVRTKVPEKDEKLTAFRALFGMPPGRREPDDDDVARAQRCIYVPAYDPEDPFNKVKDTPFAKTVDPVAELSHAIKAAVNDKQKVIKNPYIERDGKQPKDLAGLWYEPDADDDGVEGDGRAVFVMLSQIVKHPQLYCSHPNPAKNLHARPGCPNGRL